MLIGAAGGAATAASAAIEVVAAPAYDMQQSTIMVCANTGNCAILRAHGCVGELSTSYEEKRLFGRVYDLLTLCGSFDVIQLKAGCLTVCFLCRRWLLSLAATAMLQESVVLLDTDESKLNKTGCSFMHK